MSFERGFSLSDVFRVTKPSPEVLEAARVKRNKGLEPCTCAYCKGATSFPFKLDTVPEHLDEPLAYHRRGFKEGNRIGWDYKRLRWFVYYGK